MTNLLIRYIPYIWYFSLFFRCCCRCEWCVMPLLPFLSVNMCVCAVRYRRYSSQNSVAIRKVALFLDNFTRTERLTVVVVAVIYIKPFQMPGTTNNGTHFKRCLVFTVHHPMQKKKYWQFFQSLAHSHHSNRTTPRHATPLQCWMKGKKWCAKTHQKPWHQSIQPKNKHNRWNFHHSPASASHPPLIQQLSPVAFCPSENREENDTRLKCNEIRLKSSVACARPSDTRIWQTEYLIVFHKWICLRQRNCSWCCCWICTEAGWMY